MRKALWLATVLVTGFLCGCQTELLPAEDVDVPIVCARELAVLKNPKIPANSADKYYAALNLSQKVDFRYARDTAVLEALFCPSDARVDNPYGRKRTYVLLFSYGDKSVAYTFSCYDQVILNSDIKIVE